MRIVLTGGTGTIGRALARALADAGDDVVALTRNAARARDTHGARQEIHEWAHPTSEPPPPEWLAHADAVINLLGEPVAQRWTGEARAAIRDSRVLGTRMLIEAIRALPQQDRPTVLISQSATGYYGPRADEQLDEDAPAGSDFLATIVSDWERAATAAQELGVRVTTTRTGVVLSPQGGALAKMLPFFKLGIGGPVAGGRQYVPWVHLDDVVGAMRLCLTNGEAHGAVNLTAPNPVTNAELARALGRALHRPAVLPVPAFALRSLYGEMAEIVTTGQRVIPKRLRELGYAFRYADIDGALRDVVG